uniref:TATA box binding protein associated factor (TAF) histone-like fold domain-containing protein n=1 Tax=Periophthalmus magnuspinnatus TaxID=409849 RepID=A0A3B3ZKB6_9GOBI
MADREERRFAEVSRDSVKLMAEGAGVELGDDLAALLAEDVCYRLREATQLPVHEACKEEETDCGRL